MDRVRHRDRDVAHFLRSALVHRPGLLDALRFQPVRRLIDRHDLRRELRRQRYRVVDVIEVAVRDADRIHAVDFVALRVGRIPIGPRVHQDRLTGGQPECEGAMP